MPNDNWITPEWILQPVCDFYDGVIDLDPYSSKLANTHIKAKTYYSLENNDDGHNHPWWGNVWANPPYSKPNLELATKKAYTASYFDTQILMLIPAYTSTGYFKKYVFNQASVLFWNKRIHFLDENFKPQGSPNFHSVLVYWGSQKDKFRRIFDSYGFIV